MTEIKTEIVLRATPEEVWKALTSFEKYPEWNPFIISVKGKVELGSQLENTMLNNGKEMVFRPIITKLEINHSFEWLGTAFGGLFKGRHYFILEGVEGEQTKLSHGEKFTGLLSGVIMMVIKKDTLHNFQMMNKALQKVVEK